MITEQNSKDYQTIVADILKQAKTQGADQAEVIASLSTGLSVNIRSQEVDTIEFDRGKGLSITVYYGKQKGSASTSDLSPVALKETVSKACSLAKIMAVDEYCGLADAKLMAYNYPNLDLFHPWGIDAEQAKELAIECEQYGLQFSSKISNSDGASVNSVNGLTVYGNSHGFIGESQGSRHSISCVLIAKDQDKMQRDYWYSVSRLNNELDSLKEIGERAAVRTISKLNPRQVKTQKAKILFSPEMARGILSSFISAVKGSSLYREASFLLNKQGEKIFSDLITLTEDPYLKNGLGSTAFDGDGVRTQKRVLVDNGVLTGYVLSSYSARRLGLATTGNAGGIHNLLITPGSKNQQELIKSMGAGLLVTELMGQGVNIVTGDYSRGAGGYWIENGEIQYPVDNITIAGNLADMFKNIVAIGSDIDRRGGIQTGSILIDSMMIAGG